MNPNIDQLPKLLDEVSAKLYEVARSVDETIDPIVYSTEVAKLATHLQIYTALMYIKEIAENLEGLCNRNMPIVAQRAEKLMTAEGIDEMRMAGRSFSPDVKTYVSYNKDATPDVHQFLRDNEGGDLLQLTVHPKTFESWLKVNFIDKGLKVPEFINVYSQNILKVRKVKTA